MRALVLVIVVTASLAACATAGSADTPRTSLTISFRGEPGGKAIVRTLRCDPAGGTLLNAARACARLAALQNAFAPTPKDVACTEIYGGPETSLVTGTYRGRSIWARFARRDGCEIDRWNRHAFLFPFRGSGSGNGPD